MKQGIVKFFQKLLVYFWGKKHEHVSPHFYTTLTRVLHDPMFIGNCNAVFDLIIADLSKIVCWCKRNK